MLVCTTRMSTGTYGMFLKIELLEHKCVEKIKTCKRVVTMLAIRLDQGCCNELGQVWDLVNLERTEKKLSKNSTIPKNKK